MVWWYELQEKNDNQKHSNSWPSGPSNSEFYLDHAKAIINFSNHSFITFNSSLGWDFTLDKTGDQMNTTNTS